MSDMDGDDNIKLSIKKPVVSGCAVLVVLGALLLGACEIVLMMYGISYGISYGWNIVNAWIEEQHPANQPQRTIGKEFVFRAPSGELSPIFRSEKSALAWEKRNPQPNGTILLKRERKK